MTPKSTSTESAPPTESELTDIGILESELDRACLIDESTEPETVFGPVIYSLGNKNAHDIATAFLESFEEDDDDPRKYTTIALARRYESFYEDLEDEIATSEEEENLNE